MAGRFARTFIFLCCIYDTVILRSIDQVIQEVESNYTANYDGPDSKFPTRVWYDYNLKGRAEELVKLQLDMIITKDTWNAIIDTDSALPTRNKRNAIKESIQLWPRMIHYHMDERFDIAERYKLLRAMDHWEEHTCLKFKEINNNLQHSDIIEFKPVDYGCESVVGRMGGRQPINLAKPCMYLEIIVHEIAHALGLLHEHMRVDRDSYVMINYQNVDESNHPQFDKLISDPYDYQKPYDYESVMHYGKLFFSVNRSAELLTIVPTNEIYLDIIGEARGLSYNDVKLANELYNCSAGCIEKPCPGGFLGKNCDCYCRAGCIEKPCPGGFLGKNCDCYCRGADSYDIVLCKQKEPCGMPGINQTAYNVVTSNYELISPATDTYFDGTYLTVENRNLSCGYQTTNYTCKNGTWEGELPACEKECTVEDLGEDYSQKYEGDIAEPGDRIPSGGVVYVRCSNMRNNNNEEYRRCSDGEWDARIRDIVCVTEHPYCPMIINSTIKGSFQTGFKITCLKGYKLETQSGDIGSHEGDVASQDGAVDSQEGAVDSLEGDVDSQEWAMYSLEGDVDSQEGTVESFSCAWTGVWKPYKPVCTPASCKVPEDIDGDLYNIFGEVMFGGSEVIHGQHIEYHCPSGHVPDSAKLACKYGEFDTPGAEFPVCRLVTCPDPDVQNTAYEHKQIVYQYGDAITVPRCIGVLEFVGKHTLKCLDDGTWSSTALCRPFCLNGKEVFENINNMDFVKILQERYVGLANHKACKRKCINNTSYLCRSFAYGTEEDSNGRRWRRCRIFAFSAEEYPEWTQKRKDWTITVRKCELP